MKNIILGVGLMAITLTACTNGTGKTAGTRKDATAGKPQVRTDTAVKTPAPATANGTFPAKAIIDSYLGLKNALTKDNGKDAAAAGNSIIAALSTVDTESLPKDQVKSYIDIADDLKENAEHIGANAGKIDHQREHFEMLSKDIADLLKTFGNGGQTLYNDFCPMANNGKGAIWISEVREIKNPYLGIKMLDCGSVKETFQ